MKDSFVAWVYILAWKLLRRLPEKTAYSLFNRGAKWLVKRDGKSVQRLRKNLARVSPDLSTPQMNALLENAMASYMRYWCDTFRFPNWDKERINSTVTVTREELLLDGIKSGQRGNRRSSSRRKLGSRWRIFLFKGNPFSDCC
jgi:phosphatidylinositol dimannoside acyltransferase